MLVYGDRSHTDSVESVLTALRTRLETRPSSGDAGLREWGASLVIEAGELVQAILDALGRSEETLPSTHHDRLRDLALAAARVYLATEPELSARAAPLSRGARAALRALDGLAT